MVLAATPVVAERKSCDTNHSDQEENARIASGKVGK
jgi:hypothetical protein